MIILSGFSAAIHMGKVLCIDAQSILQPVTEYILIQVQKFRLNSPTGNSFDVSLFSLFPVVFHGIFMVKELANTCKIGQNVT